MNSSILTSRIRTSLRPHPRIPWTGDWVCKSCRKSQGFSRSIATKAKPYYVTTPIFYVNAAPHIGHMYTMVLADTLKRWQVLKGKTALLCTGTDEHGMKIQQAASKADLPPKEFCDAGAEVFKTLANSCNISYDHFVRTTDEEHVEAVQHVWRILELRELIYETKHEGWYSVSDETFYPESVIEKRMDPFTGKTFMASCETGKEVEWTSEVNYHFRLSAFKDRLLKYYEDHPDFIVPATRYKDVVRAVKEDLRDLSISRPTSRLQWGIRVPNDESQTIYVWLDALVNYITKAGYPWPHNQSKKGGWPADVQVIGKDIVRFHCIYWPAFLMALDIPLPTRILTHAHWTMLNQKMSKSIGNVVNPFFAIERFGVDTMRYYLLHQGGIMDDSDYGNDYIVREYKSGLQDALGNLVSRVTRGKKWSVRKAVIHGHSNEASHPPPEMFNANAKQAALIDELRDLVSNSFQNLAPSVALRLIMHVVHTTNKYMQDMHPWKLDTLDRKPSISDEELVLHISETRRIDEIIFHVSEAIRVVGILLQPFIPAKAEQLLNMLGVEEHKRGYDYAKMRADDSYGTPLVELGKGRWSGTLFPPLPVED